MMLKIVGFIKNDHSRKGGADCQISLVECSDRSYFAVFEKVVPFVKYRKYLFITEFIQTMIFCGDHEMPVIELDDVHYKAALQ